MDWKLWLQFTGTGVAAVVSFAALFAGLGYFRQGRDQSKLSTNSLLKEQIDALESKVNTQTADIEKMSKEIIELRNAVELKDKKITEFMEIFQGRDPQMASFIQAVQDYIKVNTPLLEIVKSETVPTIRNLQKYLDKQQF